LPARLNKLARVTQGALRGCNEAQRSRWSLAGKRPGRHERQLAQAARLFPKSSNGATFSLDNCGTYVYKWCKNDKLFSFLK